MAHRGHVPRCYASFSSEGFAVGSRSVLGSLPVGNRALTVDTRSVIGRLSVGNGWWIDPNLGLQKVLLALAPA